MSLQTTIKEHTPTLIAGSHRFLSCESSVGRDYTCNFIGIRLLLTWKVFQKNRCLPRIPAHLVMTGIILLLYLCTNSPLYGKNMGCSSLVAESTFLCGVNISVIDWIMNIMAQIQGIVVKLNLLAHRGDYMKCSTKSSRKGYLCVRFVLEKIQMHSGSSWAWVTNFSLEQCPKDRVSFSVIQWKCWLCDVLLHWMWNGQWLCRALLTKLVFIIMWSKNREQQV